MKKTVAIVLIMCMFLMLFAGCSGSSSDNAANTNNENNSSQGSESGVNDNNDSGKDDATKVTIEETVLYDENGIKLTALQFFETETSFNLSLKLENNSDKSATFYVNHCLINGFSTRGEVTPMSAEAGSECIGAVVFKKSELEHYGKNYWGKDAIATITSANASVTIGEEEFPISFTLTTSAADGTELNFDDSGEKIYEKDGITIIYKEVGKLASNDAVVMLFINNTDKEFVIESYDEQVNGVECFVDVFGTIFANSVTTCYMVLDPKDLSDSGIEKAENISFNLSFSDTVKNRVYERTDNIEIDLSK